MSQIALSLGSGRICKRQGTKLPQNFAPAKMGKFVLKYIENMLKYVEHMPK